MKTLLIATRPSALARWQTQWVIHALQQVHPNLDFVEHIITTTGDKVLDKPLPLIGGKGLFTQELEAELLSGRVHAAVHSLKDLPVDNPAQLTIGAIPQREDASDALISAKGYALHTLPQAAVIGTSSLRRSAQLLSIRPDLCIESLRGNIDTRLRKAYSGQYDAIILASAGLIRLGLAQHITEKLSLDVMLPAPAQGALAVQCRTSDEETLNLLAAIDHLPSRQAVCAERAFLQGLGGGCSLPLAAFAQMQTNTAGENEIIHLRACVLSFDGSQKVNLSGIGANSITLGMALAQEAIQKGAHELLKGV